MNTERTLVLIKPDGVRRGLIGEIISRFERKGLKIKALKMLRLTREKAEEFYSVHRGKPFFVSLIEFMTSGPIIAMILEGDMAISVVRRMIGPTDGREAPPGTIRGDYSLSKSQNVVHASDSPESAMREIRVIFKDDEIIDW
ncbi:nucleoside diphosphate kinase [Staphylothermus marinus F1]|uniref:Nucleoside diphosphate kinase n=1 Tax=Staphylothermus marinus (strain ATCC 43588 / DSM 3639 / JCM 9404 / F1) TaxID=399550 RepID=NDK_STAMF|nr:nucleoside-diphosphate kinase [Staphylothermus marinus]A3DMR9.1 RecName: Full=Nucleoside diphosphate kinase; Short=NDK; Short=NDP kinase; AltName: Full=Nucleoside-2-P kinase [Staphylothermus marinus F1]ABN69929.1 nucleoside diphosphate kinase [Staphylothermus marinus F1]